MSRRNRIKNGISGIKTRQLSRTFHFVSVNDGIKPWPAVSKLNLVLNSPPPQLPWIFSRLLVDAGRFRPIFRWMTSRHLGWCAKSHDMPDCLRLLAAIVFWFGCRKETERCAGTSNLVNSEAKWTGRRLKCYLLSHDTFLPEELKCMTLRICRALSQQLLVERSSQRLPEARNSNY